MYYIESPLGFNVEWVWGLIVSLLSITFFKFFKKSTHLVLFSIINILFAYFIVFPNFWQLATKIKNNNFKPPIINTKIVDAKENTLDWKKLSNGKVVVLDIWHSRCGYCFIEFPKFQKLYNKYKNDKKVYVAAYNLPNLIDGNIRPDSMIQQYTFHKLYAKSVEDLKKININAAPLLIILDKTGKTKFVGNLDYSWNIFIDNTIDLIEKLKNE